MQDVEIQLTTKHKVDGQTEETVHRYLGKGVEKTNGWYLTYKEQLEGAGEVNTTLKVAETDVTLLRQGSLQMKQLFQKGVSSHSPYAGPFGRFSLETHTRRVRIYREQGRPTEIRVEYQLWLNEQYAGEHELIVNIHWK
jgi:uncharacterized beta-barrel protein YwiB (DUF1934 family)